MPIVAERLRWDGAAFHPVEDALRIAAADSWLVTAGRVREFDLHVKRFAAACAVANDVSHADTSAFLTAVAGRLPSTGRWFPRVELGYRADGLLRFDLLLRVAPPQTTAVRMWPYRGPDRRIRPSIKGADLGWLDTIRRQAIAEGADEAVLLAPDDTIREGATTALLWWRADTLCAATPGDDILGSVTVRALLALAESQGFATGHDRPRVADLAGLETWTVNALHGIRPVTAWTGTAVQPGPAMRAARWQRELEALATELVSSATTGDQSC